MQRCAKEYAPMGRFVHVRRLSACLLGILAFLSAGLLSGQAPSGAIRERCTGDVELPIQVRVIPEDTPHPGAALRVRVLVEAKRPFSETAIRVLPPADVPVRSGRTADLGPLAVGRPVHHEFTIVIPAHGQRRTVDVVVRATSDEGLTIEQGATLNVSFDDEPSRVVTEEDGTKVREVPARRIQ
jgi:hypothetical protein